MKKLLILALSIWFSNGYSQQGGMWVPSLLKGQNEKEMKNLGMKISVSEIYNVNSSSLKDAVPQFNGGCTSEVVSDKGLLLTNHHCGYGQIQAHSTLQNDYLTNGFVAKNLSEELPNPGTDATFIVRIEDVTSQILKGTENISSLEEKEKIIQRNINATTLNSPKEPWQENRIKTFFKGNQYLLFVVEVFKDVRLVMAPPSSIGKFGSDTDNWVWPRHTGDFSVFRIYADKNNRPAEYSKDNVPYKPKHFFPISLKGIKEGDFTFVFGYPGYTNEYLPAIAVEQLVNQINPARVAVRDAVLKVQDEYMRKDPQIKIQYASRYARTANYWKKWKGENLGLIKSNAVDIKKKNEAVFQQKAAKNSEYASVLANLTEKYNAYAPYNLAMTISQEVILRNNDLLVNAHKINELKDIYEYRGEQSFVDRKNNLLKSLEPVFKDYNKNVDRDVFEKSLEIYLKLMPKQFIPENLLNSFDVVATTNKIYSESALTSYEKVKNLLSGTPQEVIQKIKNDVGVQFEKSLTSVLYDKVMPNYQKLTAEINDLEKIYMKAILEYSKPSDRIFPDANSTLRVTYGKIKGYSPADAVYYEPITHLEGAIEKYIPEDYEFDMPQKLRELYQKKDYGIYGKNGKMPVCFIATNHTTGGNSGSPAIDANGNLIGINFDRVWEGTMSDIYYSPDICRNIMVDIRYVLFIIDKYADAKHLIEEMKIIK
ncbi:MAG: S46 family peptidase [Capnocytophaga sp.]|nr:S46 family peptidase [Capnocytophaga sp.]